MKTNGQRAASRGKARSYHSVLAHQHYTIAAQGLADLVHLLGADIFDSDNENGLVVLQQRPQTVEVDGLVSRFAPHIFGVSRYRIFKVLKCGFWFF